VSLRLGGIKQLVAVRGASYTTKRFAFVCWLVFVSYECVVDDLVV